MEVVFETFQLQERSDTKYERRERKGGEKDNAPFGPNYCLNSKGELIQVRSMEPLKWWISGYGPFRLVGPSFGCPHCKKKKHLIVSEEPS